MPLSSVLLYFYMKVIMSYITISTNFTKFYELNKHESSFLFIRCSQDIFTNINIRYMCLHVRFLEDFWMSDFRRYPSWFFLAHLTWILDSYCMSKLQWTSIQDMVLEDWARLGLYCAFSVCRLQTYLLGGSGWVEAQLWPKLARLEPSCFGLCARLHCPLVMIITAQSRIFIQREWESQDFKERWGGGGGGGSG